MGEFKVLRTGNAPLKFRGELVAEVSSRRVAGAERNRWHEIAVYRTEKSKWVVWVAYRTLWQGEQPHDWADVVATPAGIIELLRVEYDPAEYVKGYPASDIYAAKQARLLAQIREDYVALISEVAEAHPEFADVVD